MFVHGELVVALGNGLGPVIKTAHIVLRRHVGARDQATALLGDALQKLSAFKQESFVVKGVNG